MGEGWGSGEGGREREHKQERTQETAYKGPCKPRSASQFYIPTALPVDLSGTPVTYYFIIALCVVTLFIHLCTQAPSWHIMDTC